MKFHEVDMEGRFWVQRVTSNPAWHESYAGRLIYNTSDGKFYKSGSAAWEEMPTGDADNFLKSNAADTHSGTITPNADNTINLGSGALRYATIYAVNFEGIVTTATYADLAEKFTTKEEYPEGTILKISESEDYDLEACQNYTDDFVGIVSKNPGFIMNNESPGQLVGLIGRIPIRVIGPVRKSQKIIVNENGCGIAVDFRSGYIAISLESNPDENEKLVMCFVK